MTSTLVWVRQRIVLQRRNSPLNNTEREIALCQKTVLFTQIRENSQTFFFFFAKPESKMFKVIAREEFSTDGLPLAKVIAPSYSIFNAVIKVAQLFIAHSAQSIRDMFPLSA